MTWTAADDTLISELIDQVSDWVQHYTGRRFVPIASTTYLFDTSPGGVLRIPMGVRSVTALGIASTHQPDSGGTYTNVSSATILLRPPSGSLPVGWPYTEIWLSRATTSLFVSAQNGASVTGTFGFAATPPDIQSVTIDGVVAAFQNRKNGASGVMGVDDVVLPPWASFFSRNSPQRGTLDRYRYFGIG